MVVIVLARVVYNCVSCGYDSRAAELSRRRRLLVLPFALGVTVYTAVKLVAVSRNGGTFIGRKGVGIYMGKAEQPE